MEGKILSLARIDAWIITVMEGFASRESRVGHRQKTFADTFARNVKLQLHRFTLVGRTRQSVEWCEPKELNVPIERENEEARKEAVLGMNWRATMMVKSSRRQVKFITVCHEWSADYTGRGLGKIYHCFIAEFCRDCSKIIYLRCKVD